jgi:AcrR family transcriptional regulator
MLLGMSEDKSRPANRQRLTRVERRELTRERLLDAAAEVFNRLGYHGASLDAVAEAAGYTKGAVYSNFATKGDLFLALLMRHAVDRARAQGQAVTALPLEQIGEYAGRALVEQVRSQEDWDLLQIEFWLAAMRDPVLRQALASCTSEAMGDLGEQLDRKFAETGRSVPFTGQEFAALVNALGTGLLLDLYVNPGSVPADLFRRAVDALLGMAADRPVKSADDPGARPTQG